MADDPKRPENPVEQLPDWDEINFEQSLDTLFEGVIDSSQAPPPVQALTKEPETSQEALGDHATSQSLPPLLPPEEDDATALVTMPSLLPGSKADPLALSEEEEKTIVGDSTSFLQEISPALVKSAPQRLPLPSSLSGEGKGPRLPLPSVFRSREETPRDIHEGKGLPGRPYELGTPPYGAQLSDMEARQAEPFFPPPPERTPPYGAHVRLPLPPSLTGEKRATLPSPRTQEPSLEEKTPTMRFPPPAASPSGGDAAPGEEVQPPFIDAQPLHLSPAQQKKAKEPSPSEKTPKPPGAKGLPRPAGAASLRPPSGAAAALARFRAKETASSGQPPAPPLPLIPLPKKSPPVSPAPAPLMPNDTAGPLERELKEERRKEEEARAITPFPAPLSKGEEAKEVPPAPVPAPGEEETEIFAAESMVDLVGLFQEDMPPFPEQPSSPLPAQMPPPLPAQMPPPLPAQMPPPLPPEPHWAELSPGAPLEALPPDREDTAVEEDALSKAPHPELSLEEAVQQDIALLEEELLQEGDPQVRGALAFEIGRLLDEVLGEVEGARDWYKKALRIDPSNRLTARALRADAERRRDHSAALDALRREITATGSSAEQAALLLDAATLWQRLGSQAEEQDALGRAMELAPGDACVLQEWLYTTYRAEQWDEFTRAALAFARQPEAGALAGALFWEVGWIEETRRLDPAAAERAFILAEEAGEVAATRARERLLLRRGDFAEVARLAAKKARSPETQQALALACLRAPREVAAPLLKEAELPPSLLGALAEISVVEDLPALAQAYTNLAGQLFTPPAQGSLLMIAGLCQGGEEEATRVALSYAQSLLGQVLSLNWVQASLAEGDEVTQLLSPLFPELTGLLLERYTKDPSEALLAFCALLSGKPSDPEPRYNALRLGLLLDRPDALFDALFGKLTALPEEERPLRAIELMESARGRGEEEKLDAVIAETARENAPFAAAQRAAWAAIQKPEHLAERGAAYVSAADALTEPWARGALLAHAAMYLEQAGDLAQAWDALSRSLLARPEHTPSREAALHLAARAKDHAAYRTLREGELALAVEAKDRQRAAAISFDIGTLLEEQGEHEAALARYMAALEHWSDHAPSVQALCRLAAVLKDWEAYAEGLTLLAEQRRNEPAAQASAFLLAGEVYDSRLDHPEFAKEALKNAREVSPSPRAAARAEEALLWRAGDAPALFALYRQQWEKSEAPLRAEYALRLARLAADQGSLDESTGWYHEALTQSEPTPLALFGLEGSALACERWPDLCEAYERLSQTLSSPEEIAACEINLIALRRKAGVGADSLPAHYTRLLDAVPDAPVAQRLALLDRRARKDFLGEAQVAAYLASTAKDEKTHTLWKTREGEAKRQGKDLSGAQAAFSDALALAPDYLPALWGQARTAREQNDLPKEISTLERLGELLSDPKEAGQLLQQAAEQAQAAYPDGEEARRLLWRALSRDPNNLEAFTQLRSSLSPSSREAAIDLRQILEKRLAVAAPKERPPLLRELASLCLERLSDPDGAQAALRELAKSEDAPYQILADLAELEEKQGYYQEAADLFVRVLRVPELTPQQKRDAYWHLALIYDEHLPDIKRATASYQHVLLIGGAAEREAAFRLAQIRARTGERVPAQDLFNRVALNQPDTRSRIQCYLRIARFWNEIGDSQQAVAAGLRALALDERDMEVIEELARIYLRKKDERARRIHLRRAALSFRTMLWENPGQPQTYQALVKIFHLLADPARAACAAMLYDALGGSDAEVRKMAPKASFSPLSPERFLEPAFREKIRHPDARPGLRALLPMIGDALLRKIFPAELRRHGVSAQDRIASGPVVQAAQLFGRPLGAPQVSLYAQRLSPHVAAVEHTSPPSAVFGSTMLGDLSEPATRFLVARSLYLIGQGPLFAASLGPVDLRDVLFGVALALRVPLEIQKTPRAEEISRLVGSTLTRKDPTLASSLVLESLPGGDFPGEKFSHAVRHEANRAALLLSGDPRAALEALVRLHGGRLPPSGGRLADSVVRAPEVVELLQFLLSEDFVSAQG